MEQTPQTPDLPFVAADLPLSLAQERLWFLDQLEPGNSVGNHASACRLTGQLDMIALDRSLNEIVQRHESLRMIFPSIGGKPALIIHPGLRLALKRVDLQGLPPSLREDSARHHAIDEARVPFDVARGSLVRICVWQLSGEDHILLVTMHPIISDGQSMEIFFQELSLIYPAFVDRKSCPLPGLSHQYTDFCAWQRRLQDTAPLEDQLSYWKKQLVDCPGGLQLPTDHPRPSKRTYRRATHAATLPPLLSDALQNFCREQRVSFFNLFLAAFKTLLYRYTEQEDIVVGVTVDGRHKPEFESLIGCFAQSLPLRSDLSKAPGFHEFLSRVSQTVSNGFSNQDLSFEQLLRELQPERDLGREPLFQVSFHLRVASNHCATLPGMKIEALELDTGLTRYDLALELVQRAEGVDCQFKYSQDLFEAATVARMAGHFQTLLQSIVSSPQQSITCLPMLPEAERLRLLGEQNDRKAENGETGFSHEIFEAQAARTPGSIAVISESETLTYRELNHCANQLAHYLQDLGVRPEVPVGICLERSVSLVVAVLAVLKAGGACFPLDPGLPNDRLAFMVEAAGSTVILTEQRFADQLSGLEVRIVKLDTVREISNRYPKDNPIHGLTDGNLGQIFFTSGSTGDPKAVIWNQRKQSRMQSWAQKTFELAEHDRYLMKSAISFTPLNLEIFWPLHTGARLFIAPPGIERDSGMLVQLMEQHRITVMNFVPSMLRVLLEEPGIEKCTSLRQVICFGEPLSPQVEERFFSRLTADLSVIYGTTEAPSASFRKCKREDPSRSLNIGQRLPAKQIYILNSSRELVPTGVPGEIGIGGEAIARGYLNRPDLTAERFVPNPFSTTAGARLYLTGDRARYLADGSLEVLGRTDDQVKIRGFRIEPGEIERTLERAHAVQQAVVVAKEDRRGEKCLVAYVVPRSETAASAGDLRRFARQWLPDYMVPAAFVLLSNLPLMSNGKLNRRALPAPDWNQQEPEVAYIPPSSLVEKLLATLFEDVLKRKQIGIRDNFFELGGNSLLATQLMSRVRKTLQVKISFRVFFEAPFVEALALSIVQACPNINDRISNRR